MLVTGQFRDIDNNLYTVKILTDNDDSTTLEIGDNNGLYFSGEPVSIEMENDDTFEHIIRKSATINLVCDDYFGDVLWASNSRTNVVNILKNGTCVFAGYVEPNTFSQPFAKPLEEFTINCTDALTTLQYYKYKNANLTNYDTIKTTLSTATFKDMLEGMFDDIIDNICIDGNVTPRLIYDCSKGLTQGNERSIFADLAESETYIFGDEFDDAMTQEEVLNEIMQYLNLHIIQEGFDFYIFDYNTLKNGRNSWFDILNASTVTLTAPTTITLTSAHHAADDTNITVADVYNQISVTCSIENDDVVIESPLENKEISSLYSGKQLYCREYITMVTERQHGFYACENFDAILMGRNAIDPDHACKTIDWYVQAINNNKWRFHTSGGTGDITSIYEQDSNGIYKNQWKVPQYMYNNRLVPSLLKWGSVEKDGRNLDNEPTGKVSMTNYLYIPVNGNNDDTQNGAIPTPLQLEQHSPMIEYIGNNSGATYSPVDDETTNYIVFSGKMILQPVLTYRGDYQTVYNTALLYEQQPITHGPSLAYIAHVPTDSEVDDEHKDEKGRLYTRKFFTMEYPTDPIDETKYIQSGFSLNPPVKDVGTKELHYEYSEHNYRGREDLISKLSILECELIIGNKRLIETDIDQYGNSTFQWVTIGQEPTITYDGQTYPLTTFTLGVNPKLNDYIIGNEFNIQNTITVPMNLDTEGTAIPIKKSDHLSGAVQFRILGPINTTYDEITRRHPTWFRHTQWTDTTKYILAHTQNIILKDFEAKIYSDKGGTDYVGDDGDLIYMSDETTKFINKNDGTTFKFITQLSSAEAIAKGVKQGVYINSVINANDNTPQSSIYNATTQETAKAEEHYVDAYYREYSAPKLLMECTLHNDVNWRNKYTSTILNKTFFIQAINHNLKYNNVTVTLKEV